LRARSSLIGCGASKLDASEASYRAALMLGDARSMRPLVAHSSLSEVYRRMGERRKAQVHRTTAMAMYREMDMRFLVSAGRGLNDALS
jgi:hypothetical protein